MLGVAGVGAAGAAAVEVAVADVAAAAGVAAAGAAGAGNQSVPLFFIFMIYFYSSIFVLSKHDRTDVFISVEPWLTNRTSYKALSGQHHIDMTKPMPD